MRLPIQICAIVFLALTSISSAQVVDISAVGSNARFLWDTAVTADDSSAATPENGNADLIFDQFNNEAQWGESWFLQADFGSGMQNIELLSGVVNNAGDQATVDFNNIENSGIDFSLNYLISEGADGLPLLDISASVTNNSGAGFSGSLISFFDYNLGTLQDDSGQAFNSGDQLVTHDSTFLGERVTRQMEAVTHWEIGEFDALNNTGLYFDLSNALNPKLTLSDSNNVAGNVADIVAAQQWDLNLAPGDSHFVQGSVDYDVPAVPEPSSAAVLLVGFGCIACRRRKKTLIASV